jgi:catechol 2,3-dioxygenase
MKEYSLPAETKIAFAHRTVSDMQRALSFYQEKVGFHLVQRVNGSAALSASGKRPASIYLTELRDAEPRPSRTTGLYHVAIRLPNRAELGRTLQRLLAHDWRFFGAADHGVSEALYTADPDGNGVELYADRPRTRWDWNGGQVEMGTEPLDLNNLVNAGMRSGGNGLPPQTDVGHVHLQVSDLEQARAFYHDLLGLEVTQSETPGALFMAAGKYHHHLGVNIWAGEGVPAPPPNAVGLFSFGLHIPDRTARRILSDRLKGAGISLEETGTGGILAHDPDGNGIVI